MKTSRNGPVSQSHGDACSNSFLYMSGTIVIVNRAVGNLLPSIVTCLPSIVTVVDINRAVGPAWIYRQSCRECRGSRRATVNLAVACASQHPSQPTKGWASKSNYRSLLSVGAVNRHAINRQSSQRLKTMPILKSLPSAVTGRRVNKLPS